jgi:hypothetical protein
VNCTYEWNIFFSISYFGQIEEPISSINNVRVDII